MTKLTASVTGVNTSDILGINVTTAHNSATSTAVVNTVDTTLDVGDAMTVNLGYVGNSPQIFTGYVKRVDRQIPDNTYSITAYDVLTRAIDFFIASSNPDNPFSRSNVSAEVLIRDILALAGITNYTGYTSNFIYGTLSPVEVNLVSAYDAAKSFADILAATVFADEYGNVFFQERRPYPVPGDSPIATIGDTGGINNMIEFSRRRSDRDLRNRVVVYGAQGVYAESSASSPWLPSGYYKTVVVASPWIDDGTMAQNAADYNLTKLNRLTEELSVATIGDPTFLARNTIDVQESFTGVGVPSAEEWYIYASEHRWGPTGYTTFMELRK